MICVGVLPRWIANSEVGDYRYIFAGLYIPAVPFFVAIYQGLALLQLIDTGKVFTEASVQAVRTVKYCAGIISGLFMLGMPYIFRTADKDDAPGVILIGLIIIFASLIIAATAAVLQKLLHSAVTLQSENDLTV